MVVDEKKNVIRFYRRNVYGNMLMYPVDFVVELKSLTGQVTIDRGIMAPLEKMGFTFREVLESSVEKGR